MKKSILLFIPLLPLISSCHTNSNVVKIFISSSEEVDVNRIKEAFPDYKLEVSYASPSSYYYSFLYKSSREKDYDIFIIRDEEYITSDIKNIYVPFDENNLSYLNASKTYDFYEVDGEKYGIKLNNEYKIDGLTSYEEGHEYYLNLAKMGRHVGSYSIYKTTSNLAFELLKELL